MKVKIIGYGSIGKRHHKILHNLIGDKIIVDIHDPGKGFYANSETGNYDLCLICTNSSDHLKSASQMKDRCGLMFIEKPLSSSVEEIKKFLIEFKNTKIHVACNIRYTDAVKRLKRISNEVKLLSVVSMSNLLAWRHDPERTSYSFCSSLGGGVLLDFIHEPDFVYSIFGTPKNVSVFETRLFNDVTIDAKDTCVMCWQYDSLLVNFSLSYCSNDYIRKIDVLKTDHQTLSIDITKKQIEDSYRAQWIDILQNGPKNSYEDCLDLYSKIIV